MSRDQKNCGTSILHLAKVAKIFGKIWSYGKRGVAISLASMMSAQMLTPALANPPSPPRPGSINPNGFSVVMSGSTPVHSTATPATIPASLISSIMNASGTTNFQKSQVIDIGNYPSGTLSFAGNFVNQSTLYLISSNPHVSTATIKADNDEVFARCELTILSN